MRRIAFLSMLVVVALTAGVNLTPARSATPGPGLLEYLPDGNAVMIIDFQKIAGSSLWTTINAQDKLKGEIDKAQSEMNNLGISLTGVNSVALVFGGASFNAPTVAVSGGFEQSSVIARLRANTKIKLSSEKYKGFDIYRASQISENAPSTGTTGSKTDSPATSVVSKNETSFVFYDPTTVVAGNPETVRASVDVKTGARPGVAQNAQLSVVNGLNPSAAIRFAVSLNRITNGLKADLPIDFSSISVAFGTIDVAQGIDLDATLRSDTAENAKSLSERLNALLALASGMVGSLSDPKLAGIGEALKTVRIVNAEADVRITASVPMDLLNSLLAPAAKK